VNTNLNFIFFGTPDVASETLEILARSGYTPTLIITSPDRPQGRKMLVTPPPVKTWAEANKIPYLQPEKLDQEFISKLSALDSEFFIVVAYGKIMPTKLIDMPKFGSLNIHYSLLPEYRGASPVEAAVLNGEKVTGVTIQKMKFELDSGPIIAQEKVEIPSHEKAANLRKRLIQIGGELLVKTLPAYALGKIETIPQDEARATFCSKIKKENGLIDLDSNAIKNYNKFRAYTLWPRTFFFVNGKRVIITDALLEDNNFVIKKVLPEGKKEISYEEFLKQFKTTI